MSYPPYTITSVMLKRVASISERLATFAALQDAVEGLKSDQVSDQASDQVHRLLGTLLEGDKRAAELMAALSLRHAPTFRKNYLNPALENGLVERTLPDTPRSPAQRYRLTTKGRFRAQAE